MIFYLKAEALTNCEEQLTQESEILLRIGKRHHLDEKHGTLTTRIFRLSTNDEGKLSHFRSSVTDANKVHSAVRQHSPDGLVGIWGLTLGDVHNHGLRAVDDSICEMDVYDLGSHAYVDFRNISGTKMEQKQLRASLLYAMNKLGRLAS